MHMQMSSSIEISPLIQSNNPFTNTGYVLYFVMKPQTSLCKDLLRMEFSGGSARFLGSTFAVVGCLDLLKQGCFQALALNYVFS